MHCYLLFWYARVSDSLLRGSIDPHSLADYVTLEAPLASGGYRTDIITRFNRYD
jgi:hypothetical protein